MFSSVIKISYKNCRKKISIIANLRNEV